MERKEYIQKIIDKYRGNFPQEFCFENNDYKTIEYHYDEKLDCLVSENVSVPFHFKLEDINGELLDRKLDELEGKVIDFYKNSKNIKLLVPND